MIKYAYYIEEGGIFVPKAPLFDSPIKKYAYREPEEIFAELGAAPEGLDRKQVEAMGEACGEKRFGAPKELDILLFLAQNRGEVFTKEQIYRAVWSEDYLLDDSNIMTFIRKLRKKIEPDPDAPRYILTIWGIGFKFNDQL